jgi:hypothetical protein
MGERADKVPVRALLRSELSRVREQTAGLLAAVRAATAPRKDCARAAVDTAFDELLSASGRLRAAVQVLHEHQQQQHKLVALRYEIDHTDRAILSLSGVLRDQADAVEKSVFEVAKPLLGKATGSSAALHEVDAEEVLKLAQRLSFATAAPPGWHYTSGLEIPFPYKPPAPQEEVIKRGLLFVNLDRVFRARLKQREDKTELKDGEAEGAGEERQEQQQQAQAQAEAEARGRDKGEGAKAAKAATETPAPNDEPKGKPEARGGKKSSRDKDKEHAKAPAAEAAAAVKKRKEPPATLVEEKQSAPSNKKQKAAPPAKPDDDDDVFDI